MSAIFIAVAGSMALLCCAVIIVPMMRAADAARPPRGLAIGLLLALPLAAGLLYLQLGQPDGLAVSGKASAAPPPQNAAEAKTQLQAAVINLQQRLQADPADAHGWRLLAQALKALQRVPEARDALAEAHRLDPANIDITLDYAEVLALDAPDRQFNGAPDALIQQVLQTAPQHPRALLYAGVAAYQGGDYARAVAVWEQLRQSLPADADILQALDRRIADARRLGKLPAADASANVDTVQHSIKLRIELDPALHAQPQQTVFVFARAINGPPLPLAARRLQLADLPISLILSDADSMLVDRKLSSQTRVRVMARLSQSGQPIAQAGDLESAAIDIEVGDPNEHRLLIDHVHP